MNLQHEWYSKKFQARDGRKAEIVSIVGPDADYPIVVAYATGGGGWDYGSVTKDGRGYAVTGINFETENDLVEVVPRVRRTFSYEGPQDEIERLLGTPLETEQFGNVTVTDNTVVLTEEEPF